MAPCETYQETLGDLHNLFGDTNVVSVHVNEDHNIHAATYRGVYDLADPNSSVFITTTGQSGHFLSQYYDNFSALWRNQDYIPMSLDLELARAGAIGITHIRPN